MCRFKGGVKLYAKRCRMTGRRRVRVGKEIGDNTVFVNRSAVVDGFDLRNGKRDVLAACGKAFPNHIEDVGILAVDRFESAGLV